MIIKLLLRLFGGKVRLLELTESQEREILLRMYDIEGIKKYWELQRQVGYQLYGKTTDRKFLGWVELSEHMLQNLSNLHSNSEDEVDRSSGYLSTIQ